MEDVIILDPVVDLILAFEMGYYVLAARNPAAVWQSAPDIVLQR